MDFGNPASMVSGLVIGMVGTGMLMYGKKAGSFRSILCGIALCVIPMAVSALWMEWAAAAACIGAMVVAGRME
jgi:uncharacterized membrane protein YeaQ/YmgE (transglycosylase-associated protein family)